MPTYSLSLVRSFIITMQASSPQEAARLTELFIGYSDISNESERDKYQFEIQEIEMTGNDVVEILSVADSLAE